MSLPIVAATATTPRRHRLRVVAARVLAVVAALALGPALGPVLLAQVCGTPGRDGPGGVLSGVVNTYFPATVSANAGTNRINVGAAVGAGVAIAAGDLLIVMQMQEATLDTRNNSRYGANNGSGAGATSYADAGRYEYVVATSAVGIGGGTFTIRGTGAASGLNYSYESRAPMAAAGHERFQVIRVPQYSSATFSSGLTALAWNGTAGGVLAVDVAGALTLGGTVSVDGKGFRGGGGRMLTGQGGGSANDYVSLATENFHASKGEGVAGTPRYVFNGVSLVNTGVEGYPAGSTARGAPGNAGGGGTDGNPSANDQNSGGGGGAGHGAGGQGGRSWNSGLDIGGRGGTATSALAGAARVLMGGGGGAGTSNNGTPAGTNGLRSSGAQGGGIVLVRAGTISGAGTITANGLSGSDLVNNDGSGGGGGGGSIVVLAASGGLGGLAVQARGGAGGSNDGTGVNHGPGGGGGGGYVLLSGAPASSSVTGGAAGYTVTVGFSFGATAGSAGTVLTTLTAAALPGAAAGAACLPSIAVIKATATPAVAAGGTAFYSVVMANAATRGTAENVQVLDSLPAGMVFQSVIAGALLNGATFTPGLMPTAGDSILRAGYVTLPPGGSVTFTFTVFVLGTAQGGVRDNTVRAVYPDPVRTAPTATTSAAYLGSSSAAENVTITAMADLRVSKRSTGAGLPAGGTGSYTLAVRNDGWAATTTAVTVRDTLPAGLTFASVTGTNWSCGQASGIVTCTRASIAARATADTITVNVTVAVGAVSPRINRAWASGGGEPATLNGDNVGADTALVLLIGVSVTPDGAAASRLPSNGTTYTQAFVVTNSGGASDTYTLLASGLPGTWVKVTSVNGVAGTGGSVTIAAGGTANVIVSYTVEDTASAGVTDTLGLRATSTASGSIADPGTSIVTVLRAGLAMSKQLYLDDRTTLVGGATTVNPGTYVQYRVTVTSTGAADAASVFVVDSIPPEVTFDLAEGDAAGWTFVAAPGTVTATLAAPLAVGASRYFWIRVQVR